MRKLYLPFILLFAFAQVGFGQIISQYIETDSGTFPKGIEIWNNTASVLDFSANNLVIEKGVNGGTPALDFTLTSGTLAIGAVIVIGTSGLQTTTESNGSTFNLKAFNFNGDDALVVKYGGVITDVFGTPGSDPGSAWTGNGVSTANQNIQLIGGITTGDTDGWTDPSIRFETVSTTPSAAGGDVGFGLSPVIYPEPTNHVTSFSATANGSSQIDLAWTDATGTQLPASYLIKSSTTSIASITAPVDRTPETDDTDMSDGSGAVNVAYGLEAYNWTGLAASTNYYYKIYPYTNSGSNINYKTDESVPQSSVTTDAAPATPDVVITEVHDHPTFAYEYVEIYNNTTSAIDLTGWKLIQNNSSATTTLVDDATNVLEGSLTLIADGYAIIFRGLTADYATFKSAYGFSSINSYTNNKASNSSGSPLINGNETYELQDNLGNTIDYFGDFAGGVSPTFSLSTVNLYERQNYPNNGTSSSDWVSSSSGATAGTPGSVNSTPLPVELTSFTATAMTKGVMLNWSTATEVNNYGFEVQKSEFRIQNSEFETIEFVEGHGNSNSPKDYSFIDNSLAFGEVSYRLKQIDIDGAFEYSDVVTVTSANLGKYELYQNHPNPFNPSTVINFSLPEMTRVKITVYNSIGQKVTELLNKKLDAGYHKVEFDASNLSSGFYIYRLETPNYSKTMKMILLR